MPMGARRLAGQPPLSNNQLLPARSLVLTVATSVVFSETPNLDFYVKYSDFKLLARFKKKKKKEPANKTCQGGPYLSKELSVCEFVFMP